MAHVHTEPGGHDLTISAYIVLIGPDKSPRLWLHKHKKLGVWLQFGGHVERTENPWQALEHEIPEESGYTMDQLRILQPDSRPSNLGDAAVHPVPASFNTHRFDDTEHFHTDLAFTFITNERPRGKVAEGESSELRLMTQQEIESLSTADMPVNAQKTALYILNTVVPRWVPVACAEFSGERTVYQK